MIIRPRILVWKLITFYPTYQSKLATWLLESCSVRSTCGSASAMRWLEAAAQEGDKNAADKLAQLSL